MTTLTSILLQSGGQSGVSSMLMIVAMIAIFYFVMIRPQSKKQKELKRQREAMQKGDRVVSAGGIHGKISSIKENTILVKVAPELTLEFDKTSIYPVANGAEAPAKELKDKE
ncbi:MAG: preprotein translocase subunit YajC [Bacteroides sp.]|nr:preprotein translocase subunit YajC [Bacteroides sp.]